MYLIKGWGGYYLKDSIDREDLVKVKKDRDCEIINLSNYKIFDPSTNQWVELKRGVENGYERKT